MEHHDAIDSKRPSALPFVATTSLIIYGSLYPFEFHLFLNPAIGFVDLLATWKQPSSSLGDLLANVLFYFPLGLFAARALPGMASWLRVLAAVLTGVGLSVSMEFAQIYDAGRVSAMSDVYTNSLGTLLGAVAGTALSTDLKLRRWQDLRRHPFAALLLFCWLAYWLFPYVPVIDAHKYWHAVRPLLVGPNPTFGDLSRNIASWVGVGAILESVWGCAGVRKGLPLVVVVVFCARIGIASTALSRGEAVGAASAIIIWGTWLYGAKRRAVIVATIMAAGVLFEGLEPFQFLPAARPFRWIPFLSLLNGSIWIAIPSLMAKFALYGTLLWSLARLGLRWTSATSATAAFVFLIHYVQTYLPGRSAEITDTLLALIAGGFMKIMDDETAEDLAGSYKSNR